MPKVWIQQHDVHTVKTLSMMLLKQSQAALAHHHQGHNNKLQ
jgi:hypothetical protein